MSSAFTSARPRRSFTVVEQLQEHINAFITAYKRDSLAIRLDQEKGLPAVQESPNHSALISS
jgi:hypothetical protein